MTKKSKLMLKLTALSAAAVLAFGLLPASSIGGVLKAAENAEAATLTVDLNPKASTG